MPRHLVRLLRAYVRERRSDADPEDEELRALDTTLFPSSRPPADDEAPIFILAASWRSGSTLVQRLVMSGGVLVWGEPYHDAAIVQALTGTIAAFRPGWPVPRWIHGGERPDELARQWVANLFPPIDDLWSAHRALFQAAFAMPARRIGISRWGLKEVRLTAAHARYLRWLYPRAKFLFLHRSPLDAYASYRALGGSWRDRSPGPPVLTPTSFGRHWRRLAESFVRHGDTLGAMTIRYEDLVSDPRLLDAIDKRFDLRVDRSLLSTRVDSRPAHTPVPRVSALERWLLAREVEPIAGSLGYRL